MYHIAVLLTVHRSLILALLGFGLWMGAVFWYFRRDLDAYRKSIRPHNWRVDLETRKTQGGRRNIS